MRNKKKKQTRKKKTDFIRFKNGQEKCRLDLVNLRRAVLVLRAVNHRLRQRMIDLLIDSGGIMVTDIYIKLRLEQSIASQHLAILRRAGVLVTKKQGKFIYYSLDKDRLRQIKKCSAELADGYIDEIIPL